MLVFIGWMKVTMRVQGSHGLTPVPTALDDTLHLGIITMLPGVVSSWYDQTTMPGLMLNATQMQALYVGLILLVSIVIILCLVTILYSCSNSKLIIY